MNKNKFLIHSRKKFVKLSIDDPERASRLLNEQAEQLKDSRELGGTIEILSRLLFLSEQTIYLDVAK